MKLGSHVSASRFRARLRRTSAEAQQFPPEQIKRGAAVYATYCVTCHGWQMEHPGGSFDLRAFPSGQFARFANAVIKGKNNMPPWGDVLGPPRSKRCGPTCLPASADNSAQASVAGGFFPSRRRA